MEDFFWRALAAAVGVAVVAGPLGCFVVWRRMAYFGDSLAHGALLGVALGLALGTAPEVGIAIAAVAFALILVVLQRQRRLPSDTALGIMAHAGLALALVALGFVAGARIDLVANLFGDVLGVGLADLAWIFGGGALALALLAVIWQPLLAATIHEDMARTEGLPVTAVNLVFVLLIALLVAMAMKIVGVLLITALLIIPAATARRLVATPEGMAVAAAGIGALAAIGGLYASFAWDTPSGPSIVVAAALFFALGQAADGIRRRLNRASGGGPTAIARAGPESNPRSGR